MLICIHGKETSNFRVNVWVTPQLCLAKCDIAALTLLNTHCNEGMKKTINFSSKKEKFVLSIS